MNCSSVVSLLKMRADFCPFELVVLIAPNGDRRAIRLERAGQPLGTGAEC